MMRRQWRGGEVGTGSNQPEQNQQNKKQAVDMFCKPGLFVCSWLVIVGCKGTPLIGCSIAPP